MNILVVPLEGDRDYLVYSDGRIFSKKTNKFLTGMIDGSGYHCFLLRLDGKSKFVRTNQLIAKYFVPNPKGLPIVNHIDGNKLNNNYKNLEWVSYSTNTKKYYERNVVQYKDAIYAEDNNDEKWIDIKDFPRYEVSDKGRVRVKTTKRLMRYDESPKYARLILQDKNKERKHLLGHILVYTNFHKDFNLDGYVIDHIDNNPRNNCLENLQKITPSENSQRQARFQK